MTINSLDQHHRKKSKYSKSDHSNFHQDICNQEILRYFPNENQRKFHGIKDTHLEPTSSKKIYIYAKGSNTEPLKVYV